MMQQIRDSLNGPLIVGVLLAIIGVPFAFSGIEGYFQNDANPAVAKIGDTEITQDQLRRAYDQRYRQTPFIRVMRPSLLAGGTYKCALPDGSPESPAHSLALPPASHCFSE